MGKIFKVLSWNVKHFGDGSRDRKGHLKPEFRNKVKRVTDKIKEQSPDIFALYEVKGQDVFFEFMNHFTGYTFHITEGQQTQEILLGVKNNFTSFITQKLEFKAGNPNLRPGLFLTAMKNDKRYSFLFLHLKSMKDPYGWGMRSFMWEKVRSLRKVLGKIAGGVENSNMIILGDLNLMGMNVVYGDNDVTSEEEIKRFTDMVKSSSYKLKHLSKNSDDTYRSESGSLKSDLDHVFASDHLKFKPYGGYDVNVAGWPELDTEAKKVKWIQDYSDHAMLIFEIHD